MTTASASARDTPGRAPSRQQIVGLLVVNTQDISARYECYRPGCPMPHETPLNTSTTKAFIGGIKARHLSQYHGETP
ncbi:hypothetical protein ACSCBZ_42595 [Streptomyces niveiscabiei]|uniref:hypothetical protein n=1 Tax=Streptomyces niveiscabiei TaxID=164115 RepID=UPI0006EBD29C|nr:hypothetical protein [Streptomyces niveiscabiei]